MTDESFRARLEALNRGPLPAITAVTQPAVVAAKRAAVGARAAREPAGEASDGPCPVGGLLRSGEVVETPFGPHLRIVLPLENLWPGGTTLMAARQEFLRSQLSAAERAIEPAVVIDTEVAAFVAALPDRALALDLETCGLAGSALFLVGLLRQKADGPAVELLLARNYAEEAAVLASMWQIMAEHEVLLTFNGKSFDWPMVVERSIRHRLQPLARRDRWVHIDILHHARRRWRKRLPDCRLQTLERHVCRRTRVNDIPGHAIPGVYADFVRSGFERDMERVLYHNALDLVTLVDLAHRLAA